MSEPRDEIATPRDDRTQAATLPLLRGRERLGLGLIAVLLIVALVATGPLWVPLLPWAAGNDAPPEPRNPPVEAPRQPREPPMQPADAAASAALQRLDRRVAALETRPAEPAGDLAGIRQQVAKLADEAADLARRVAAIDKEIHSQTAGGPADIALVLALLQIREAAEAGRPFAAAFETLDALAQARPEIAAAAAPLAEPAQTGLPGRPALAARLRELAGAIATANAPGKPDAEAPDWADQAMARLRGIVTIRRIDAAGQGQPDSGPAAAVDAALRALAGGDLDGAVGALAVLTGAPEEAARPWLRMAKERLAAEAALRRIEALLVARLGAPANAQAGSGPPR